jgi:hypothetical protein
MRRPFNALAEGLVCSFAGPGRPAKNESVLFAISAMVETNLELGANFAKVTNVVVARSE